MSTSIQNEYLQLKEQLEPYLIYGPARNPQDVLYVLGFRRDMMVECSTFNQRWHLRRRIYRMLRDILLQAIQGDQMYDSGYISEPTTLITLVKSGPKPLRLIHRDGTDAAGNVWELMEIDLSPFVLEPSLVEGYFSGFKPKTLTLKMFETDGRPMVNCLFDGVGFF